MAAPLVPATAVLCGPVCRKFYERRAGRQRTPRFAPPSRNRRHGAGVEAEQEPARPVLARRAGRVEAAQPRVELHRRGDARHSNAPTLLARRCGDGVADTDLNEQCDLGANNGLTLNAQMQPDPVGQVYCNADCTIPISVR